MRFAAVKASRVLAVVLLGTFAIRAQTPAPAVRLTAATQNVSGAGEAIKITISNWSTDAQKDEMIAAWTLTNVSAPRAGAEGRGARGAGRGATAGRGARGGRGAAPGAAPAADAPGPDLPVDPDAVDLDSPAFRFGRGGARGGGANAAPATPEASLAAALKKAPTLGVMWTSETVGYSIKYAYREQRPEGGERIILATDRRVGAWSNLWKPTVAGPTTDYAFSIIEFRLNAGGEGEGKGAVFGNVAVDAQAKTIGPDSYNTLPVILKNVKRQSGN
jgi:hypothetical protein